MKTCLTIFVLAVVLVVAIRVSISRGTKGLSRKEVS